MSQNGSINYLPWQFTFFLIALGLSVVGLLIIIPFSITGEFQNLSFSLFQLGIGIILIYLYIFSIPKFNSSEGIIIKPAEVLTKSIDKSVVKNISKKAKGTLQTCRSIWFTVILGWIILYTFLALFGLGYIRIEENLHNFILRQINYLDTLQMFLLYTLYSTSNPNINFKKCLIRNLPIIIFIIILVFCDSICEFAFSIECHQLLFTITGAFLSSLSFLLFFSRLDSIFLQFNKFFLGILITYGILQSTFPLFLSGYIIDPVNKGFIITISSVVFLIAKLSLGVIFTLKSYLERQIYYFSSIYFLGPFTKNQLSIAHSFYVERKNER